jgi:hypothetical protein
MASAQMAGDGQTVIAAAEKLRELIPDEVARGIAMVQPVKAAMTTIARARATCLSPPSLRSGF